MQFLLCCGMGGRECSVKGGSAPSPREGLNMTLRGTNSLALDLKMEVSDITAREIKVEPRAFIGIELPLGWRVGVRANPLRKVAEVLKPILTQHHLKLDSVVVYDIDTNEPVDVKWPLGRVDGHNLNIKAKGDASAEATTQGCEMHSYDDHDQLFIEDDQASAKSSSHASSVFRGFLRRSSKKYKKDKNKTVVASTQVIPRHTTNNAPDVPTQSTRTPFSGETPNASASSQSSSGFEHSSRSLDDSNGNCTATAAFPDHEATNVSRPQPAVRKSIASSNFSRNPVSPLGLISELNIVEQSRNRKPIYINQGVEQGNR